jgi:serine phosphatase RsbU (regulator of sigma subunit)/streptogramin lyase
VDNEIWTIHGDPDDTIWFGTLGNGISRYDGKGFVNFTQADGLASNFIRYIYRDTGGVVWVATNFGVSSYNEEELVNFTTKDGLVHNDLRTLHCDPDGVMWLGADEGGISRYDGKEFVNFTQRDGLVNNKVVGLHCGPDGVVWVGMWGGLSRYDGKEFTNFTTEDGLAHNWVRSVHVTSDGILWVGTYGGNGVSRYDGKEFVNFTWRDGLAGGSVDTVYSDPDGVVWFGATRGISRYDGTEFVNLTTRDGLPGNDIAAIYRDPDGTMWFGTDGGVSQYDGKDFVNFTVEDGLTNNTVLAIHRDPGGMMWFGTYGGGVSRYDGTSWASLGTRDGLAGDSVTSIHRNSEGYLWFATEGGITRYLPSTTPPKVRIASVTTDQLHTDLSAIPACVIGTRITIEYKALDFRTHPEKQQYRYRIKELDLDWRTPTKEAEFDWTPAKVGTYTFVVQAIDRDLNYSEPASLEVTVVQPFYLRAVFLVPAIGSGIVLLVALVILATALIKRRRQVHSYQLAAVQELQDARGMQMSLLPRAAPQVADMEIAGKSITANTVGGDFFDYLPLADGRIGIVIADVSGKGLKAAMNAVMASGMLYEVVKTEASCGGILSVMNAGLYPRTEKQMFTAFSFAILNQDSGMIQWSNAAQPLPMVKRGGGVSEAEGDGQLPLGMAPDVGYLDYELELQSGDTVIFYTDGIIEAENAAEEMYGTERLLDLVAGVDPAASVEDVIEVILQDVSDFVGSAEQYDDMTIVVIRKK